MPSFYLYQGIFNKDFSTYDHSVLIKHFDTLFAEQVSNDIDYLLEHIYDEYEATEKEMKISNFAYKLHDLDIDYEPDLSEFKRDWQEIANDLEYRRQMAKDD